MCQTNLVNILETSMHQRICCYPYSENSRNFPYDSTWHPRNQNFVSVHAKQKTHNSKPNMFITMSITTCFLPTTHVHDNNKLGSFLETIFTVANLHCSKLNSKCIFQNSRFRNDFRFFLAGFLDTWLIGLVRMECNRKNKYWRWMSWKFMKRSCHVVSLLIWNVSERMWQ